MLRVVMFQRSSEQADRSRAFVIRVVLSAVILFSLLLVGCGSTGPAPPRNESSLVLNVRDFGAVGDGRTDDTAAFMSLLSKLIANGGGTLLIPPGTYVVGDLKIGSGISISGTGTPLPVLVKRLPASTIIDISPESEAHARDALHDISIENITLRGRSAEDGFSEHVHNIRVAGVTRLSIHNLKFENFQGDGLYLGTREQGTNFDIVHNSDVSVADNSFDGVNFENRNGISVIDCSRCVIERNIFLRLSRPNMPGAIDLEPNFRNEVLHDVTLRNNSITSIAGQAGISVRLKFEDFLESPDFITIRDNQIQNARIGIVVSSPGVATDQTPLLNADVENNTMEGIDQALILDGVAGIVVANNYFSKSRRSIKIGGSLGVFDVRFTKNHLARIGTDSVHGIELYGSVTKVDFQGNEFEDLGSIQPGGSAIYFARGNTMDVGFIGNTFSSPNHFTTIAIGAGKDVSFIAATNTWADNVLRDGIQPGTFPHQP